MCIKYDTDNFIGLIGFRAFMGIYYLLDNNILVSIACDNHLLRHLITLLYLDVVFFC